jgi:superfamily II DNA helicase RecQ
MSGILDVARRNECITKALLQLGISDTERPFQRQSLDSIVQHPITVVCARTGSGKSVIYLALPYLFQYLMQAGMKMEMGPFLNGIDRPVTKAIVLVLPYLALTWEVLSETKKRYPGLVCEHVDTEDHAAEVYQHVLKGETHIVLLTPEMYCTQKCMALFGADCVKVNTPYHSQIRSIDVMHASKRLILYYNLKVTNLPIHLSSSRQAANAIWAIVFDEAHNIATSSQFRGAFEAMLKQNFKYCKLVLLSGSMTDEVQIQIKERFLSRLPDCQRAFSNRIRTSQSREEIYIHFQTVKSEKSFIHLHWLISLMYNYRAPDLSAFPQILIYVDSLSNLRELFNWLYTWCPMRFVGRIMKYCAPMGDEKSKQVTTELFRTGKYKILVATKLLGEGVNYTDLRLTIIEG